MNFNIIPAKVMTDIKSSIKRNRSTGEIRIPAGRQVHFGRKPEIFQLRSDDSFSMSSHDTMISTVSLISGSEESSSSSRTVPHSNLTLPLKLPPSPSYKSRKTPVSVNSDGLRRNSRRTSPRGQEKRTVSPSPTGRSSRSPSANGRKPRNPVRSRRSFRSNSPRDTIPRRGPSSTHSADSYQVATSLSPTYGKNRKIAKRPSRPRSTSPSSLSHSAHIDQAPTKPVRRRLRVRPRKDEHSSPSSEAKESVPFRRASPRSAQSIRSIRQRSDPNLMPSIRDVQEEEAGNDHRPKSDTAMVRPRRTRGSRSSTSSSPSNNRTRNVNSKRFATSSPSEFRRVSRSRRRRTSDSSKQILLQLAEAKWEWEG